MNNTNNNETILNVPLTSIAVGLAWNARSGAWKRDSGFEAESAFEELKESILACGVKDPVKLRPLADGGERPFALVSGFRRYGASEELGLATIPAVVRAMNDAEARIENTHENTARCDLKPPDLAWAVAESAKLGLSDTDIARAIGMTQQYVSKLHRIMRDVAPAVTTRWRSSVCLVTVDAMYALRKAPRTCKTRSAGDFLEAFATTKAGGTNGLACNASPAMRMRLARSCAFWNAGIVSWSYPKTSKRSWRDR